MSEKGYLILEDGSTYEGRLFGARGETFGEVVFSTAMTGYQEMLTDPSYAGQILILTYPLIGNYGVNEQDFESRKIQVAGFVVREECSSPSHYLAARTLDDFLRSQGVTGLAQVDTRAVVRRLRNFGVMMGMITSQPEAALERLETTPRYDFTDFVKQVTTPEAYEWEPEAGGSWQVAGEKPRVVVLDCGLKYNILRSLKRLGCRVLAVPCATPADFILRELQPDGVVLSPGPGDPALLHYLLPTVRQLVESKPTLGICLGHQLIARAFGARTFKLKFGHRGANHPVRDLRTGRVYITAQNHGYAVDLETLPSELEVSHINLNDGTVEGLRHKELPTFSIQYHSEASPGPLDNMYIFEEFLELVRA